MRGRLRRCCNAALFAALLPARAWAAADKPWPIERYWLPEGASTIAPDVDQLFYLILYITAALAIAVHVVLLWFLLRYRRRGGVSGAYIHGHRGVEAAWTLAPLLLLGGLAFLQWGVWTRIKRTVPVENTIHVQLFAEQFQWNFRYAGNDGLWGSDDDVMLVNQLYVPVHTNVVIEATSKDVIHSFFLPYLRLKQDVLPGTQGVLWFNATKTTAEMRARRPATIQYVRQAGGGVEELPLAWNYEIVCAELCGAQHAQMRGLLYVLTREEFDAKLHALSATASKREPPAVWARWRIADPRTGARKFEAAR